MYGMHVHQAVLAASETLTGATIHVVDGDYDHGPIVTQRETAVLPDDTASSLAERVLAVEHDLWVETIAGVASGTIHLPIARETTSEG